MSQQNGVNPFENIPAVWSTAQVSTPQGTRLAVTLRTTSTTLTLLLEREYAEQLGRAVVRAAGLMSPLIVPPGPLG